MIKKSRWELYKEEILKSDYSWGVTGDNEFRECAKMRCSHCCFYDKDTTCNQQRFSWLYEEVETKHELTQMEYDVLDYLNTTVGSMNNSGMLRTLKDKGYYSGIVDFENARVEEVLSNYILVDKEISNENTDK